VLPLRRPSPALRALINQAPFRGRVPIMIGGDRTDTVALRAVAASEGRSVAVRERVPALRQLQHRRELQHWLAVLTEAALS
jgi:trehalose-6-phosphatase